MNSSRYQYVKQGRPFICLQQNPFLLLWLVFFKHKSLRLSALRVNRKTGISGFKAVALHALINKKINRGVVLPIRGQLALAVHRGYKVFDLDRKLVTRVINKDVDSSIVCEEIKGVRTAGRLECAPSVKKWDEKERWYEEDYLIGDQQSLFNESESGKLFDLFHSKVQFCLQDLSKLERFTQVNSRRYIEENARIIEDQRLFDPGLNQAKIQKVRTFLSSITAQLLHQVSGETVLTFSHGDFSLVNILSTNRGIKVIDWEGAKFRGLLHDLYNFFLTEIYYNRVGVDIAANVDRSAHDLLKRLINEPSISKLQGSISIPFYRRLHYLERLQTLLERELTDQVLDVIIKSIDVFNRFEDESNILQKS